jgi:hypothetical protein
VATPTIINPRLQKLYASWLAKRGGRRFPARADFDPIELRFILGNLILVDVVGKEKPEFRIRLHGSNLVARHGYELTGKMLSELPIDEQRKRAQQTFAAVVTSREPLHGHRDQMFGNKWQPYETLILPLSSNDDDIDVLLVGLIHDDEK